MKKLLFVLANLIAISTIGQEKTTLDSISRIANIKYTLDENKVEFHADTPVLDQIAGAPKAFYTYYWEFGDGEFSKQKVPNHIYNKSGDYKVRLWATNNYDTGKPPSTRPKKISVNSTKYKANKPASMNTDFSLERNREPIPNQEIVVVMSYKNTKDYPLNGKLFMFYNESNYNKNNFTITDVRTHHNEKKPQDYSFAFNNIIKDKNTLIASLDNDFGYIFEPKKDSLERNNLPLTLEESKEYYKDFSILNFNELQTGEERNIFFTMQTTPEMLKDTSAIISIRGVFVPDRTYENHTVKDMEMEIVTSHDPNKMSSNGSFMSYRFVKSRRVKYKIRFQNNGEGPAQTIRLETDIPEMYDKSSLKILGMYPECKISNDSTNNSSRLDTISTDNQIIFTFNNIYVPGSEQKGVSDIDSTKGYVEYSLMFNKDFHKKKTKSKTSIIFDKNDPIITNYATTRFTTGISIGAKAGYNYYPDLTNSRNYFIGVTIQPYKSYRWYLQAELNNNFSSFDKLETTIEETPKGDITLFKVDSINNSYKNIDLEIPIIMHYNINDYFSVGVGAQATVSLSESNSIETNSNNYRGYYDPKFEDWQYELIDNKTYSDNVNSSFTNLRGAMLFDVTAGFARIGPSIGTRYVLSTNKNYNHWHIYAIWKF